MVIISLTRCNRNYELGLFEDKRRMNVAITRAKRLCILVGDSVTYKHDEDYEVLFKESFVSLLISKWCFQFAFLLVDTLPFLELIG